MLHKWIICAAVYLLTAVHLAINEVQDNKHIDAYIPCARGWYFFGEKCYKMFGTLYNRLNWIGASERCNSLGGHLATVHTKEVQEFLLAYFILENDIRSWIGLNDIENETHYVWDDGTEYHYSNWNHGQPSEVEGKGCVEMLSKVQIGEPGEWSDRRCTDTVPYICQVDAGKQKINSSNPALCSSETGGGWKFGDSCYNIVEENMTWEDAEKYCQDQYKGHLVKVLNYNVNYFLKYILSNFGTDIWIGIKIKDQYQQQFSSGWYAMYTYWYENIEKFADGTCVIRTKEKTWKVVSCKKKYPFICEVSTVSPPVLKKASERSKCPGKEGDWIDLGGEFCYFLDNTDNVNWDRAHLQCVKRGGSLVSFHSKPEIDTLGYYMKNPQYPFQDVSWQIFIGLHTPPESENEFVWADGSKFDYTHWGSSQPNPRSGKCVYMHVKDKLWYVGDCVRHLGYLCSVSKITPNITETEEAADCIDGTTFRISFGVTVSVLLFIILLTVVVCYFRPWKRNKRGMTTAAFIPLQPPSRPAFQQQSC